MTSCLQEYLELWQAASESYRLAAELATRFAGKGAELTLMLTHSSEVSGAGGTPLA